MPDDFGARRTARLPGDDGAQFCRAQTLGKRLDLRGFAGALAAFKGDESSGSRSSLDRCLGHQSFSAPSLNAPRTSSLAPSIARRIVDPTATDSAAYTGASMAMLPPRQTLTPAIGYPAPIVACTGPV